MRLGEPAQRRDGGEVRVGLLRGGWAGYEKTAWANDPLARLGMVFAFCLGVSPIFGLHSTRTAQNTGEN